jgi:hypothetical protein
MRGRPRGWTRSVDRGRCGRAIEPRNTAIQAADAVMRSGRQHTGERQGEHAGEPARSQTLSTHRNLPHGNWDIQQSFAVRRDGGALRQGHGPRRGDERLREVGWVRSTEEPRERSPALMGVGQGAGRGKEPSQEQSRPTKRIPDSEPDKRCAQCVGSGESKSKVRQESTVHLSVPSPKCCPAARRLRAVATPGLAGSGRHELAAVRGGVGNAAAKAVRQAPLWEIPGQALSPGFHSKTRWPAATSRRGGTGRQDRPERRRRSAQCHL